ADGTLVAGLCGRAVFAVEGLGEDPGGRGLANATGAGEEVSVGDAIALQRVLQRAGDVFLPDQFGKVLWAITASKDGVALGRRCFLGDSGGCFLLGHDPWLTSEEVGQTFLSAEQSGQTGMSAPPKKGTRGKGRERHSTAQESVA